MPSPPFARADLPPDARPMSLFSMTVPVAPEMSTIPAALLPEMTLPKPPAGKPMTVPLAPTISMPF